MHGAFLQLRQGMLQRLRLRGWQLPRMLEGTVGIHHLWRTLKRAYYQTIAVAYHSFLMLFDLLQISLESESIAKSRL